MPTYEYACKSCGEHLEVVQSFRDEPLSECPACGGPLRKVFGAIGIAFKGSGFYSTDSRDSKGSAKSRPDAKDKPAASSGDKASGDKASGEKASGDKAAGSSGSGGPSSGDKGGSSAGKGDAKAAASS